MKNNNNSFISYLPKVRGTLLFGKDLSKISWLKVGGLAEIFFIPYDKEDLSFFLKNLPLNIPLTILGSCSNVIIRDGGIPGVVIKLGKNFNNIIFDEMSIFVGSSVMDARLSMEAAKSEFDLSFLRTIPGTIGGAVKMNSGCYGTYVSDVIISTTLMLRNGDIIEINSNELKFNYRKSYFPENSIILGAKFKPPKKNKNIILKKIKKNIDHRCSTQPITSATCGSTFLNPSGKSSLVNENNEEGFKAWELIKKSGLSGFRIGRAKVSEKHSNFLLNIGGAKADDFEKLGNYIQEKVYKDSSYLLEWEIQRIGIKDPSSEFFLKEKK